MPDSQPSLEQALSSSYLIERELGRGGMAVVYLAHDLKHDRKVALKVIRPDARFPGAAERFAREIKLAARLQHPHILPVFDSGEVLVEHPERSEEPLMVLWYTMPYVEGESLRDRLEREKQLPIAESIRIAREAAQALAHAHEHAVIHRDIKPENLLLTRDGSILVADFGIARAIAGPGTQHSAPGTQHQAPSTQLTDTGMAIGTPAYMAPEARLGAPADTRSDIYSLSAVLYEMLTGKLLGGTGGFSADLFLPDTVPLIRVSRPEVPPALDALVRKGLHPNPEQRFSTMQEFTSALGDSALPASRPQARKRGLMLAAVILLTLLAAAGYSILDRGATSPQVSGPSAVAVLPFQNIGGDTAEAYFAQGMTDELTTALVQSSNIRVASQSGIARLSPSQMTPREVGRELGVRAVLEGSVRRQGDRLRITAQLTGTDDGVVLWANRYDRDLIDVFQVQDEITLAIVAAIQGALTTAPTVVRGTSDLVAYDLYLRGRYYWSKRGREGLTKSIDYLHQAVARDSNFARAYAGLAMDYVVLPVFTNINPDSAMVLAESNAARALALDSSLAEAHLALAYTLKNRWHFAESEREFRAALTLAPSDAGTRHWYGVLLFSLGRIRESQEQMAQARTLDPFSSTIAVDGAVALYGAHRFTEARAEVMRALALDSTKSDGYLVLGWVWLAEGQPDSAIAALEQSRRFGTGFDIRPYLSVANRKAGRGAEADRLAAIIRREFTSGQSDGFSMALIAAQAGETALVFEALTRTFDRRTVLLTEFSTSCEPLLDPVRSDPRFVALLGGVGMRPCDQ